MTTNPFYLVGACLVFAVPVLTCTFLFPFRKTKDAIELLESDLRLASVIILCVVLVLLNSITGLQAFQCAVRDHSSWALVVGVICFVPLFMAVFSYVSLDRRYAKAYGDWLPSDSVHGSKFIIRTIAQLSSELGLDNPPVTKISRVPGMSVQRQLFLHIDDNYNCLRPCHKKTAAPKGPKALSEQRLLPYELPEDRGPSNTRAAKRRWP